MDTALEPLPSGNEEVTQDSNLSQTTSQQSLTLTEKEHLTNITKDCNDNPSSQQISETQSDSQYQSAPPPLAASLLHQRLCDSSISDECILIPKHAVVDDVSLKFILHPNLASGKSSGSSLQACTNEEKRKSTSPEKDAQDEKLDIPKSNAKTRGLSRQNATKSSGASGKKSAVLSSPATGEQYVMKTAKEILYDIAQGKWNRKGMIMDEETEGTKKFGSQSNPCSNASCVRAAEKERKQRDKLLFHDGFKSGQTVFEDGHLPSYHSLLGFWKYQEEQKQRHSWVQQAFKNGFPENEAEFLKVWRECRRNPQAFGIKISEPEELPVEKEIQQGSRVRKVVTPYDKCRIVGQAIEKRPPTRLTSREYYNPGWKPVKNMGEREKQKQRYEELRSLYPHLPPLRAVDYKMNPATVKHRMKQAEEWHKLVTISNRPTPMFQLSYYAADIKYNSKKDDNADSLSGSSAPSELDFDTGPEIPRYACSTTSSLNKVKQLWN